jgi:2-C-methyl-D-erythritol 4-phosphate cytidylyltransferase
MAQDTAAVVVAAGAGRRMGGSNKALLPLAGRPMLAWSLAALRAAPSVGQIVVVMSPADDARLRAAAGRDARGLGADLVVAGGAERWESSRAGVAATDPALPWVLVHDAARPLLTSADVERVLAAARMQGAALLAEALADTLKEADPHGRVQRTVDRSGLWRAQTPQAARREVLLAAFGHWQATHKDLPTDESQLLEQSGLAPAIVTASAPNFKVTLPHDLLLAEAILAARRG